MRGPEPSILALLEAQGRSASRVELRRIDGDGTTRRDAFLRRAGRYALESEIARGREGVIYRGRDLDVGRAVAIKVLRPELARNATFVKRFVEEAQIGGQLQHPGIVPVYELGMLEDGRPYFAMKLVRGKTLAERLADRSGQGDDRRSYLTIFEHVCQTMAYAHSRGVIHRDLTPSNVMIGTFGEVHVFDWGFARVLAQDGAGPARVREIDFDEETATMELEAPGRVLGDPAYMSPEQAAGAAAELDGRSDVFALGAILCEILTGEPPYVAAKGNVLAQAADARLDDADQRLSYCGADAELIAVARECLEAAPSRRPRDARAVLERVTAHLAAVEERAQSSRVEAFEAQARAERARAEATEQRRARRQTIAIAATILFAVVFGGGGYFLWRAQQRDRAERTERAVREAMRDARRYIGDEAWKAAGDSARRAVELTESLGDDPMMRTDVHALFTEVAIAQERARQARKLAEDNTKLLEKLEELRLGQADDPDPEHADAAYSSTLLDFGIRLDRPRKEVVAAVRARGRETATALAGFLYEWAALRRSELRGSDWKKLARLSVALDRHRLRKSIRLAWRGHDTDALVALCQGLAKSERSPRTLELLGFALVDAGEVSAGVDCLRETQLRWPADARINFRLAQALRRLDPPRLDESLRYLTAAVALEPRSAGLWNALAAGYLRIGEPEHALAAADTALRLRSASYLAHIHRAEAFGRLGDADGAIAALRQAILTAPRDAAGYVLLGNAHRAQGDLDSVISVYRDGVQMVGENPRLLLPLGDALRRAGRLREAEEAYRGAGAIKWARLCSDMAEAEPRLADILTGDWVAMGRRQHEVFAHLCAAKGYPHAATRFFRLAMTSFGTLPADALARYRYTAARTAILAARGEGNEPVPDEAERVRLYGLARTWLRATLPHALKHGRVEEWMVERDLAGVRDPAELGKLPAPERHAWSQFWRDVDSAR